MKTKTVIYGRDTAADYEGPLEPPDKKRCQFEKQHYNPLALGSLRRVERCESRPEVIATEKRSTRKDGKKGSMSLCLEHMELLITSAPGYCDFKPIRTSRDRKI